MSGSYIKGLIQTSQEISNGKPSQTSVLAHTSRVNSVPAAGKCALARSRQVRELTLKNSPYKMLPFPNNAPFDIFSQFSINIMYYGRIFQPQDQT